MDIDTNAVLAQIIKCQTVVIPAPPLYQTVVQPAPSLSAHVLSAAAISAEPTLAKLAQGLPPNMRLVAARWSGGVLLLTACRKDVPGPPLSWMVEKRASRTS